MTAEEIKREIRLDVFLTNKGIKLVGGGANKTTNRCPLKEHKQGHLCVSVDTQRGIWCCNDCGSEFKPCGGSVIDWMMLEQGKTLLEVLKQFDAPEQCDDAPPFNSEPKQPEIESMYDYYDETGQFVYQVCRLKPKTFRQRRKDENGNWVWNMQEVRRVLYNLPSVLNPKNKWVWVVEGEKDAVNLAELGLCATTNVGGAGKWAESYSECLKGKEVVLCGDNDKPGQDHMKKVLDSLGEKVASVRKIQIPSPHKDVSDYISTFKTKDEAGIALGALVENAAVLTGGIELPIQNMEELEREYIEHLALSKTRVLTFANWLPSLNTRCRGLVPGEMVSILAATGVGKTALLQNLAKHSAPLPTLLFEMELPGSLTFERFCAMSEEIPCYQVESSYQNGTKRDWRSSGKLNHIWTCTKSKLTPANVEMLINKAELKMGVRPALVLIDYIQLISGVGAKRYEVISDAAEELKRIAKTTKTIIVIASQVKRKEDSSGMEVSLHDAKESGAIENSCGLVLGVWRPEPDKLHIRILKNTKGRSMGKEEQIECRFDGASMTITELEKSPIDEADVQKHRSWQND